MHNELWRLIRVITNISIYKRFLIYILLYLHFVVFLACFFQQKSKGRIIFFVARDTGTENCRNVESKRESESGEGSRLTFFLIAIRDFGFPVARLLINVKRQTGRACDLFQSGSRAPTSSDVHTVNMQRKEEKRVERVSDRVDRKIVTLSANANRRRRFFLNCSPHISSGSD